MQQYYTIKVCISANNQGQYVLGHEKQNILVSFDQLRHPINNNV